MICNFNSKYLENERFDIIIVGSGLGGLTCAYYTQDNKSVALITKELGDSSSKNAQGGLAVALSKYDSWLKHLNDTIKCGGTIVDKKMATILTKEGINDIKELIELGLDFDHNGDILFGLEGMHSQRRILHIDGDNTGANLVEFMQRLIKEKKNIYRFKKTYAIDLLVKDNKVYGLITETPDGKKIFYSNNIVLATGGFSAIFKNTTNPISTIGDGISMAFRVNATLCNLEFVQFHPTTFYSNKRNLLISEAIRGEGATIVNNKGQRILEGIKQKELAGRDIVTRVIFSELLKGNKVFLDCTMFSKAFIKKRFPSLHSLLKEHAIKLPRLIPIQPAAHYCIGGLKIDEHCKTNIIGLYACGECSFTGIHGSNRLPSNSLLEAIVFGKRAALSSNTFKNKTKRIIEFKNIIRKKEKKKNYSKIKNIIRAKMWDDVGIIRDGKNLRNVIKIFSNINVPYSNSVSYFKTINMLTLAELVSKAALIRNESRGVHYRTDFPDLNKKWQKPNCF